MLIGHIDVVPPGAGPSTGPPTLFVLVLKDGFLHGRGTVDRKGGVACMLMAVEILKRDAHRAEG